MSDTGKKGKLSKDEFFTACKLVALTQSGVAPDGLRDGLSKPDVPLPQFGQGARASVVTMKISLLPTVAIGEQQGDYDALWQSAGPTDGRLAASKSAAFLGKAGLAQAALRQIWSLSNLESPKDGLNQQEFCLACKYVALSQSGKALTTESLMLATSLPKFGGSESSDA